MIYAIIYHKETQNDIPTPGVEPGPAGWKPAILAVRPRGIAVMISVSTGILNINDNLIQRMKHDFTVVSCTVHFVRMHLMRRRDNWDFHIMII